MKKTILFDLDGTMIDTEVVVTTCVQYALRHVGIEEPNLENLRIFIGPPLFSQFQLIYGLTPEQAEIAVEKYRERYKKGGIQESKLYPHVEETLHNLKEKGYKIALASSKTEPACIQLLEHFQIAHYFDVIGGGREDRKINTKILVLQDVMGRLNQKDPKELVLVGDTKYDVEGAKEAGIDCIAVAYGFGTPEELQAAGATCICDSLEEVELYIDGL
ncbi:HAD hydrolase-like protein [Lachnospiraceae bacterium ZAX-1]